MRPVRILGTILFAAAVAITGCSAHPTARQPDPPAKPVVDVPRPTPEPPNPPGPRPRVGSWELLPAAPLPPGDQVGVWTGADLLVHAVVFDHKADVPRGRSVLAAYHPATRSWRRLPPMPAPRSNATVTWDGREVLVVGGRGALGRSALYANGVAYDPAGNRWSPLPRSPLRGRTGHLGVWTGTQMLIWGGASVRPDPRTGNPITLVDGAAYTPYGL